MRRAWLGTNVLRQLYGVLRADLDAAPKDLLGVRYVGLETRSSEIFSWWILAYVCRGSYDEGDSVRMASVYLRQDCAGYCRRVWIAFGSTHLAHTTETEAIATYAPEQAVWYDGQTGRPLSTKTMERRVHKRMCECGQQVLT